MEHKMTKMKTVTPNWELKALIIRKFGAQTPFCKAANLSGGIVSEIIAGWRIARPSEIEKFCTVLGKREVYEALGIQSPRQGDGK